MHRYILIICACLLQEDYHIARAGEPFRFSLQANVGYGTFWGERCITLGSLGNFGPNNIDMTVVGMCRRNTIGFGSGLRLDKRIASFLGVHSGVDLSYRNEKLVRTGPHPGNTVKRIRHSFYQSEIPFYIGYCVDNLFIGAGGKVRWLNGERNVRTTFNDEKVIAYSRRIAIRSLIFQPSLRMSYGPKRGRWFVATELDHRYRIVRGNTRVWLDLFLCAGLTIG